MYKVWHWHIDSYLINFDLHNNFVFLFLHLFFNKKSELNLCAFFFWVICILLLLQQKELLQKKNKKYILDWTS